MKKPLIAFVLAVFTGSTCLASSGITSVFDIGIGARAQALGGAYSAAENDSAAVFYNPAAMQTLDRFEVQAAFMPLFLDTIYNYLTLAYPTPDFGTFGFSLGVITTSGISVRDYTGQETGVTSQLMIEALAGWAINLPFENLYAGFNIKVDTQGMEAFSDTGFGSDIGILYSSAIDKDSSYRAGLVVKNLIEPMVKMSAVSDTIPRQYIIAGNYSRAIDRDIKTSVFLDLYMPVGIDFVFKAGAEGKFFNIFSVRTGYDSYGIFSVGAGAEIADLGAIDYGFFITGLDITHRVSVKARFGGSVSAIRAEKERLDRERIEKRARMLAAEELKSLREKIDNMTGEARKKEYFKAVHYAKGLENYFDGNLKLALIEFETVAQVDIEYMNTRYYLGMIKGVLGQEKEQLYDKEIIRLYREGVSKYVKEDYAGAKKEWEAILKIDPYNRLALENLKEVNSILRNLEEQK